MNKMLLLVLSILAIVLGACSDDDKKDGLRGANGEKLVSKIVYTHKEENGDTWKEVYTLGYDKQGRIIKETGDAENEDYYTSTYTYTDEKIICHTEGVDRYDNEPYTNEITYMLNSDGLIVYSKEPHGETVTFTYKDGKLMTTKGETSYMNNEITWKDNNIISVNNEEQGIYTYKYTDKTSKANINLFKTIQDINLFLSNRYGIMSNNLVESVKLESKDRERKLERQHQYQFDKDGYVTKIIVEGIYNNYDGSIESNSVICTIEYN